MQYIKHNISDFYIEILVLRVKGLVYLITDFFNDKFI